MKQRAKNIREAHRRREIREVLEAAYPGRRSVVEITADVSVPQSTTRAICKRMLEDDELAGRKEHGHWQFRAHKPAAVRTGQSTTDEKIPVCPACGNSNFWRRSSMRHTEADRDDYRCKDTDCGATFNEPDARQKQSNGGESAEAILERVRADIEARRETATDGGQR